jgi:hypothetical protein
MRRHRFPSAATIVASSLIAALLSSTPARAVIRDWNNAAGGSAGTATNWTPNGVPTAGDNLRFPLSSTYSVFFPSATVPTVINHDYRAGVVNLSTDGTHTMSSSFGAGVIGSAGVNLTGGNIEARLLSLGSGAGLYGRLTLIPPSSIPAPIPPTFKTTDPTQSCICGNEGAGRLEVFGGSQFTASNHFIFGNASTGRCTVNVAGRSTATFNNSGLMVPGNALIGLSGTAAANLNAGGFMRVSGITTIGGTSTANGALRIGTTSAIFTPAFYAEQALRIGDSGFASQVAGTAQVQLVRGLLSAGGPVSLGDPDGNSGPVELRIEGGTMIASGGFTRQAHAGLVHTGGIMHFAGGPIAYAGSNWNFGGSATRPEMWVGNGLTTSIGADMAIGYAGQGLLRVVRPGTRLETSGTIGFGNPLFSPSSASAVVDSGGVLVANGGILIFSGEPSSFVVTGGGQVLAQNFDTGTFLNGSIEVLVAGSGSLLSTTNRLALGAAMNDEGSSRLTVESDATADFGQHLYIDQKGSLVVRDASVRGASAVCIGPVEMVHGLMDVGVTSVTSLRGNGRFTGSLDSSELVDPAPAPGDLFGVLEVDGSAGLEPSARLAIALGRESGPANDSLRVAQALALDGTLALEAHPSFLRVAGEQYVVATAANITGAFSSVTWNGGSAAGLFDVVVEPTRVVVTVLDATLDVDRDPAPAALRLSALRSGADLAFALELPEDAEVQAVLYDLTGRQVARLAGGRMAAGVHGLHASAGRLPSGVYFARAEVTRNGRTDVRTAKAIRLR